VPPGNFFLVNAGYANTTQFLAPYRGTRYHLQEQGRAKQKPRDYKELFNLRHAQLRNHIERAIGILKMRFPILKTGAHYPVNKHVDISSELADLLFCFLQRRESGASVCIRVEVGGACV
jgi:hypothetical protein